MVLTLQSRKLERKYFSFQGIAYICKDGMKMKDDFDRKNVILQCKANNNFDEVLSWPQCISSKK